jgi:hypothetical protein
MVPLRARIQPDDGVPPLVSAIKAAANSVDIKIAVKEAVREPVAKMLNESAEE